MDIVMDKVISKLHLKHLQLQYMLMQHLGKPIRGEF